MKTVTQPQLTYAASAWAYRAKTHLKRLQAVENIALRVATAALWFIRNDKIYCELQFTPFREVIDKRGIVLFQGTEATRHAGCKT